jgi:hypothetical protein
LYAHAMCIDSLTFVVAMWNDWRAPSRSFSCPRVLGKCCVLACCPPSACTSPLVSHLPMLRSAVNSTDDEPEPPPFVTGARKRKSRRPCRRTSESLECVSSDDDRVSRYA